ncbi:MAG: carbohydrate porin [Bacteroidales bacterium]|nr:carbohydrate porin [Bacteroidales bacterium]
MIRRISFIPLILGFTLSTIASNSVTSTSVEIEGPLELEATYIGDIYNNFSGGLKTGGGFLGMANLKIGFDTEKANWWKGGRFFVNGASTHGKSPTENYTGDFQVVSNIDAGNLIYLHELWFKQSINRLEFTVGLQDMNATFVASDNGSYYLNSSFGVPPVISGNIPVPIFPLTGLGLSAIWNINDNVSWLAAMFDGSPTDFENNPYNLYWDWDEDDGLFIISEFDYTRTINEFSGTYKGGFYYHTGGFEDDELGLKSQTIDRNFGFYFIGDQTIWRLNENKKIDLFTQLAWSPGSINSHNFYAGGGFNFHGLLEGDHENTLGVAVAHAGFHRSFQKHETVIETFFKYQLNNYISLQPDFQLIINPASAEEKLNNALIGFIRVGIQF